MQFLPILTYTDACTHAPLFRKVAVNTEPSLGEMHDQVFVNLCSRFHQWVHAGLVSGVFDFEDTLSTLVYWSVIAVEPSSTALILMSG
jgi:hypothetical protein